MNSKCALAKALLDGRVVNIKNCFRDIGLTNAPREISRMIEKSFGVVVSRTPRKGKNRYGDPTRWTDYRLNKSEHNQDGIQKMIEYLEKKSRKPKSTQTPKPKKQLDLYD